jgi:hypothetical protein
MKDKDDLALEALFASQPIADDGFSRRVIARVRRRQWVRRLALPIAVLMGGAIAAKPALAIVDVLRDIAAVLPFDTLQVSAGLLPHLSAGFVIAAITLAGLMILPTLDD